MLRIIPEFDAALESVLASLDSVIEFKRDWFFKGRLMSSPVIWTQIIAVRDVCRVPLHKAPPRREK